MKNTIAAVRYCHSQAQCMYTQHQPGQGENVLNIRYHEKVKKKVRNGENREQCRQQNRRTALLIRSRNKTLTRELPTNLPEILRHQVQKWRHCPRLTSSIFSAPLKQIYHCILPHSKAGPINIARYRIPNTAPCVVYGSNESFQGCHAGVSTDRRSHIIIGISQPHHIG